MKTSAQPSRRSQRQARISLGGDILNCKDFNYATLHSDDVGSLNQDSIISDVVQQTLDLKAEARNRIWMEKNVTHPIPKLKLQQPVLDETLNRNLMRKPSTEASALRSERVRNLSQRRDNLFTQPAHYNQNASHIKRTDDSEDREKVSHNSFPAGTSLLTQFLGDVTVGGKTSQKSRENKFATLNASMKAETVSPRLNQLQTHNIRFKELQDEILRKVDSRVELIQLYKSLNRVPYPMIFMSPAPGSDNEELKKRFAQSVNTTQVTIQQVQNKVKDLVGEKRTVKWSQRRDSKLQREDDDANSTPTLIQNRFDILSQRLGRQNEELSKKLSDQRSSLVIEQFEARARAAEPQKIFARKFHLQSESGIRFKELPALGVIPNRPPLMKDSMRLDENSIYTTDGNSTFY